MKAALFTDLSMIEARIVAYFEGKLTLKQKRLRDTEYVVTWGYSSEPHSYRTEAAARKVYDAVSKVPSYLDHTRPQPATLTKIVTTVTTLETNRP